MADPGVAPDAVPIAIVGVGESAQGEVPGRTALGLQSDAIAAALDDAGLTLGDIDGLMSTGLPRYSAVQAAEYHGIRPTWFDSTEAGGASFPLAIGHAAAAIAAEQCRTVLIVYGSDQRSRRKRRLGGQIPDDLPQAQFEAPFWPLLPISAYALAASRHHHVYGTSAEALATIAVTTRAWAMRNPSAFLRTPLSVDDVLASPMVSSPIHRDEICLVTDGGGAVLVTSRERARDLRSDPVVVLGHAEATSHHTISQMPDLTVTAAVETGRRTFAMAGLSPADVDLVQLYDSFTITVLLALEDLGFCAKGEGGPFVADGRLGPGGTLPANTSGGGLAWTHPGMLGVFLLIEAVRQLRGGLGERQVPDAEVALVHGVGGVLSSHATVLLGRDR
jgi:acetyl-CoA acetyltransferase